MLESPLMLHEVVYKEVKKPSKLFDSASPDKK